MDRVAYTLYLVFNTLFYLVLGITAVYTIYILYIYKRHKDQPDEMERLMLRPLKFLKHLDFIKQYRHRRVNLKKRRTILQVFFMICTAGAIFVMNKYEPLPPVEDILFRYRYFFIGCGIAILISVFYYTREIVLSILAAVFLLFSVLAGLCFLNTSLDRAEKISYEIIEKYEDSKTPQNDYFLRGIDPETEREVVFPVYPRQYEAIDLERKRYWAHVEEGDGFFGLRWRKAFLGFFEYPAGDDADSPGERVQEELPKPSAADPEPGGRSGDYLYAVS